MENEKNIQIIKQLYADFENGNLEGILKALTDDVSWTDLGYPDIPYAGKRNGKKEVQDYFEKLGSSVSYTQFDQQEFYADKDAVIVKGFFAAKVNSTGKAFDIDWVMIWKLANDKIYFHHSWIDTLKVANAFK